MSERTRSSIIGSSLILAGTAIGAGMLALPLVGTSIGLIPMLAVFIITAGFAVYSGLLMLEANLAIEPGSNLYNMSSQTLGSHGRVLATLAPLGLFYALMTAYLSGGGALFTLYLKKVFPNLPLPMGILLFAVFSGCFIYCSTRVVDYLNRFLFIIMIACLLVIITTLLPQAEYQHLMQTKELSYVPWVVTIPIIYTSFGYHGSIPSIILYQKGAYKSIPTILLLATLIPLLVYVIWLVSVMGSIPDTELQAISQSEAATAGLIKSLAVSIGNKQYLHSVLHTFSDVALLTSLLGVALGLFDYLASLLGRNDNRCHRAQTASLTFIPPVIFGMVYPEGFIAALGFAAIPLSIIAILLPAAIVMHIRGRGVFNAPYRTPGGKGLIFLCFVFGVLVIITQLIAALFM